MQSKHKPTLIYYVHHHGSGHVTMFKRVAPKLARRYRVIAITSDETIAAQLSEYNGVCEVRIMPSKWTGNESKKFVHTFSKAFEGIPKSTQATNRVAWLADLCKEVNPRLFISDVSAELVIILRSMGITCAMIRLFGNYTQDPTQVFAYELCDRIIAPYDFSLEDPKYIYGDKTLYTGMLSAFPVGNMPNNLDINTITILMGYESIPYDVLKSITADISKKFIVVGARSRMDDFDTNVTVYGRVDDISKYIDGQVVITAGGLNSVSELLSLGKKLVVLPEERPYDEQMFLARALVAGNHAVMGSSDYSTAQWQRTITSAAQLNPLRQQSLVNPKAAELFAEEMNMYA